MAGGADAELVVSAPTFVDKERKLFADFCIICV